MGVGGRVEGREEEEVEEENEEEGKRRYRGGQVLGSELE